MEILRCLFTAEFAPRILLSARSTGKRTTRAAYPRSSLPRTAAPTAPAAYSKEARGTADFANSRISRCNAPLSAAPALVRVHDAPRRIPSVGRRTSGFFSLTCRELRHSWVRRRRREGKTRLGRKWCRCNLRPRRSTTLPGPLRRRASVSVLPFASFFVVGIIPRARYTARGLTGSRKNDLVFWKDEIKLQGRSKREQMCSSNRLDFKFLS